MGLAVGVFVISTALLILKQITPEVWGGFNGAQIVAFMGANLMEHWIGGKSNGSSNSSSNE